MSKQPLTNEAPQIIIVARTVQAAEDELAKYNFQADDTDSIPPVIMRTIVTTMNGLLAVTPSVPCVIVGNVPSDLEYAARMFFGGTVTMAAALKMINNEVAIRRDQIQNGTVPQK